MGHPFDESRTPVAVAQMLFVVNAMFWTVLGILTVLRATDSTSLVWLLAVLIFANAGVMLWLGWALGKQRRLFYYLAIAVLAVNLLLTVTDEFGLTDLMALLIDAVLLVLLIITRSRYVSGRHSRGVKPEFSKERR